MSAPDENRRQPHWGYLSFFMMTGLILIGLVVIAETANWGWTAVWQSIIVNLGTSLLLAAVVFLAEPRFTRTVAQAAERGVADSVRAAVVDTTGEITQRLDDLESELLRRKQDEALSQEGVVTAVRDEVSQRTISQALHEANQVGAISGGITVRAAPTFKGPYIQFQHVRYGNRPPWHDEGEGEVALEVSVEVEKRAGEVGTPVITCKWTDDMSAADVDAELRRQLKARGFWEFANFLDLSLALKEFARGVQLALASSRLAHGEGNLRGALIRLVDDKWAITEAGIECPSENYLLSEGEFPEKYGNILGKSATTPFLPETPVFANDDIWAYLIHKGVEFFPNSKGIAYTAGFRGGY